MTVVVVAEKPSVGRDLARVLGATQRGEGTLFGNGYVVTWAIGHLVGLAQPEGIRPEWKRWSRATLPMLPQEWPLQAPTQLAVSRALTRRMSPGQGELSRRPPPRAPSRASLPGSRRDRSRDPE